MTQAVRIRILTCCLAVLAAGPALTQEQSSEASPTATVSADVAYVYVGTAKGVNLYAATLNGKLTLVSGSPFTVAGTAAASNGKYFITLGTQYLHSYAVASNGAIKAQVSQINTKDYADGDCGTPASATLDLTGENVYVLINPVVGIGSCTAYQSIALAKASGALTFVSAAVANDDYSSLFPLTITSNNQFAFAENPDNTDGDAYIEFQRQSNGALETFGNRLTGYFLQQGDYPWLVTAGQANSLAFAFGTVSSPDSPAQTYGPVQLASYTVDSSGNLTTTNPPNELPVPSVGPTLMNISPSGELLAVAGSGQGAPIAVSLLANGLQIFHFNGPDPITPYSKVLTGDPIDQMEWDDNDHLFALSDSTNKLYVYTVTPTTIAEAPGSPYTIASPNALVVVSNLCSAPASDGVHICSPVSGSSVSSPVLVTATAKVTGTILSTQLWVDGVKNFNAPGSDNLTTSVSLAAGSHRFAVIATNTSGQKWESTVTATVK